MLPFNLDSLTPAQRLIVEQTFVLANKLESAADSALEGQVIDCCKSLLLGNGRDVLRRMLETTLQSRADSAEKKTAASEPARVERRPGTRATRPKR